MDHAYGSSRSRLPKMSENDSGTVGTLCRQVKRLVTSSQATHLPSKASYSVLPLTARTRKWWMRLRRSLFIRSCYSSVRAFLACFLSMDCLEEVGGKLVRKLVVFAHNESRLKIYNNLIVERVDLFNERYSFPHYFILCTWKKALYIGAYCYLGLFVDFESIQCCNHQLN